MLDIHVLCNSVSSAARDPDGQFADLRRTCSDELQARCAGFIEAEIDRYRDELQSQREVVNDDAEPEQDDSGSETDTGRPKKKTEKRKKVQKKAATRKTAEQIKSEARSVCLNLCESG